MSYKTAEELTDAYVGLLTRMRPLIGRGLSAAVYTQTSDVEIEVNGLMTYDRDVVKMDLERIAAAANKLYLPPPIVKTLVPTSQSQPQTWKYTFEKPGDDWFQTDFEDADWKSGPGGFGTEGTPGTSVRTVWNTSDIWIRRTFDLDDIPSQGDISLTIHHDEDAEVYINGRLVQKARELHHQLQFVSARPGSGQGAESRPKRDRHPLPPNPGRTVYRCRAFPVDRECKEYTSMTRPRVAITLTLLICAIGTISEGPMAQLRSIQAAVEAATTVAEPYTDPTQLDCPWT